MSQAKMKESNAVQLEAPRFEDGKSLLIAGLRSHFTAETMRNVPDLWARFAPHIGSIPGQVGGTAYGLCFLQSNGVDYLAGVEVSNSSGLPAKFSVVSISAPKYAVFPHRKHVSKISETCDAIGQEWLPKSGYQLARVSAEAPSFFERYSEEFNPQTGMGGMEVWVPIQA